MKQSALKTGMLIGNKIADEHEQPIAATFARFSEEDFPDAVEAGFLTGTFEDYRQQLAGTIAGLEQRGHTVTTIPVTASLLIAVMHTRGLPNTPDGYAEALAEIARSQ